MTSWTLNQYVLLGLAAVFFGFNGFQRGVQRELRFMLGVILGVLLANHLAVFLQPTINRFYRIGAFVFSGGLSSDDMVDTWQQAQALPELVSSTDELQLVGLGIFLVLALAFYAWGQGKAPAPHTFTSRLLGFLAGAVNGFLLVYYLFPIFFSASTNVIQVPSSEVRETLTSSRAMAILVAVVIMVVIIFGLFSSTRSDQQKR